MHLDLSKLSPEQVESVGDSLLALGAAGLAAQEDAFPPQEENNERYAEELCPYCQGSGKHEKAAMVAAGTQVPDVHDALPNPLFPGRRAEFVQFRDEEHSFTRQEAEELAEAWGGANAITASAAGLAPEIPPADWFKVPEANGPTPLTITADGQVYGHAALWNTCHTGIPGRCTTPPRSPSQYRYFHLGATETEEGETVSTGKITFGAGHAPLTASRAGTAAHYDNTAHAGADVVASDGRHGIWVAGALRPGLPARAVKTLKAAALSGDWRSVNGALELIGLLAVNVPGFPVPRAQAMVSSGALPEVTDYPEDSEALEAVPDEPVTALVAAGIYIAPGAEVECEPCADEALDELLASIMDYDVMLDELTADAALDVLLVEEGSPAPQLAEVEATVPVVVDAQGRADRQRRTRMQAARMVGNEPLAQALENAPDDVFTDEGKTVNVTVNIASAE